MPLPVPPKEKLTIWGLTDAIRSQSETASSKVLTSPSGSKTLSTRISQPGVSCSMIPAMNVPCPATGSR